MTVKPDEHETRTPRSPQAQQSGRTEEPVPRKPGPEPAAAEPGDCGQVEQTLDDALADSFPASDPVSIVTSQREEAWERQREEERDTGRREPEPRR